MDTLHQEHEDYDDGFYGGSHVLVVGAAGIDVKGHPTQPLMHGVPVTGIIRSSVGGVARNVAENLARLDVPTILLSVVGDDDSGDRVLACCEDAGVDVRFVQIIEGERTGHYMATLTEQGELDLALSDYSITRHIDPDYLQEYEGLFQQALMVVIDASLEDDTLQTLFALAESCGVPVVADPTSPYLADRLRPYLHRIFLVTPNVREAAILCEMPSIEPTREAALPLAQCLLESGVRTGVITLGVRGLVYASGTDRGHIPATRCDVVDETGAGDALTSGVIFGLLNHVPLDEALRLGVSAATLTLQSRETVVARLSQELLYNQLVI